MFGFVYVLFVLGQLNKKIYIIMALILPKLDKPTMLSGTTLRFIP